MAIAKTAIKYFKYVDTVRTKRWKLRTWKGYDKQSKSQREKDRQNWSNR